MLLGTVIQGKDGSLDSRHFENLFHIGCIYTRVEEKKDASERNLENYFLKVVLYFVSTSIRSNNGIVHLDYYRRSCT